MDTIAVWIGYMVIGGILGWIALLILNSLYNKITYLLLANRLYNDLRSRVHPDSVKEWSRYKFLKYYSKPGPGVSSTSSSIKKEYSVNGKTVPYRINYEHNYIEIDGEKR